MTSAVPYKSMKGNQITNHNVDELCEKKLEYN
jgi:hypothetical protein